MKQRVSLAFVAQRESFVLRFTCEFCTYFDPTRERCTHGYPTTEHRLARYASPDTEPSAEAQLIFCKEFELC
jgi:hypothetical protein